METDSYGGNPHERLGPGGTTSPLLRLWVVDDEGARLKTIEALLVPARVVPAVTPRHYPAVTKKTSDPDATVYVAVSSFPSLAFVKTFAYRLSPCFKQDRFTSAFRPEESRGIPRKESGFSPLSLDEHEPRSRQINT